MNKKWVKRDAIVNRAAVVASGQIVEEVHHYLYLSMHIKLLLSLSQIDTAPSMTIHVYTHTHNSLKLCIMLVVMMRSEGIKISRLVPLMLILFMTSLYPC